MTIENLHKVLDHVVALMERAEHRTVNGHKNAFKYLPKYSDLLRHEIKKHEHNKDALIGIIKEVYGDSYVRLLHEYEKATVGPAALRNSVIKKMANVENVTRQSSERHTASPMSNSSSPPMSPATSGMWNTFNLASARAAKAAAKKRGGTRRRRRN